MVVLGEETEHPRHRVHGQTQAPPQGGHLGNRVFNQLSEGLLQKSDSRGQGTPRSPEATGLQETGRRVQTLGPDPRPLIEIARQTFGPNRPIGQSMRLQDRDGPAARHAQKPKHHLLADAFRIGVALVVPMTMNPARATARTDRP